VRTLPAPLNATAAQPLIDVPPSVKLTLPVGFVPLTVAVNVTVVPTVAGLAELATTVVVGVATAVMTCDSGELLEAALAASPP
jgi:hypothetical protein